MDTKSAMLTLLVTISIIILILALYILFCRIPAKIAKNKGRSFYRWFWFSFLINPILGIIIVACLSETDAHRRKRIEEEELIKRRVWGSMNENPSWEAGKKESLIDKYREP